MSWLKVINVLQQAMLNKTFDSLTNIEHVVISMGEDGVNWLHATHPLHAQAPKVIVKVQ